MTSAISGRHAGNNPATSCQRPSHNSDVISISGPYREIYFVGRGKFTSLSVIRDTEGRLGERIQAWTSLLAAGDRGRLLAARRGRSLEATPPVMRDGGLIRDFGRG
jgi:hypothetical protein